VFDGNPDKPMIAGLSVVATRLFRRQQEVTVASTAEVPCHTAAQGPTGHRHHRVMMAVLLQVLDTTYRQCRADRRCSASFSATQDTINWVLTSYIVASAIALPISGWMADKVGP
jgi:DHA2 family multidrug resistance protein